LGEVARAEAAEVDRIDLLEGEGNVCNLGKNCKYFSEKFVFTNNNKTRFLGLVYLCTYCTSICRLDIRQGASTWSAIESYLTIYFENKIGLMDCAGVLEQTMSASNRVGIGLSYRHARLHRLAESIPVLLKSLKYRHCIHE
jgi:hypothetical protein